MEVSTGPAGLSNRGASFWGGVGEVGGGDEAWDGGVGNDLAGTVDVGAFEADDGGDLEAGRSRVPG